MPRMYLKRDLPPCPDTNLFVVVRVGGQYYWRRKRGTVKPATLNDAFRANANNISITSKAAKEILHALEPSSAPMFKERRLARLSGLLIAGLNNTGILDYNNLKGFELQEKHPLKSILKHAFTFFVDKDMVGVRLQLTPYSVKPAGKLLTHYFFEVVLVYGELLKEHGLRVETETSEHFALDKEVREDLSLSLLLPEDQPWMMLFGISCMEGKDMAMHPKSYVMRVVGTGRGRKEQSERILL